MPGFDAAALIDEAGGVLATNPAAALQLALRGRETARGVSWRNEAEALRIAALALSALRQPARALDACQEAIALAKEEEGNAEETTGLCRLALAWILEDAGAGREACEAYEAAIASLGSRMMFHHGYLDALIGLGRLRAALGDTAGALRALDEGAHVVRILRDDEEAWFDPQIPAAVFDLGRTLVEIGQPGRGLLVSAWFADALQARVPEDHEAQARNLNNLAQAAWAAGEKGLARESQRAAVRVASRLRAGHQLAEDLQRDLDRMGVEARDGGA